MAHHSDKDLPERFRQLFQEQPGPTLNYPQGKLGPSDDGEILLRVAADPQSGKVLMDFGTPTKWIAFDFDQAIALADLIRSKALAMRGITA